MSISSSDNYIDPSDVELEAEEYESQIEDKKEEISEAQEELENEDGIELFKIEARLTDLNAELKEIESEAKDILELHTDCEHYARGSSLINESFFTEYIEDLAKDCGDISENSWLYNYIDWSAAAEDCKMDYTTITFEGTDFYVNG